MTKPDHMEPFTAQVHLSGLEGSDPAAVVAALLEELGRRTAAAGSSLLGHIKAYAQLEDYRFHCHLTSLRSGVRCEGRPPVSGWPFSDGSMRLDLAVLVYGLERDVIAVLVEEALRNISQDGLQWSFGG